MANTHGSQGGTHEQHVHAGQQSHKNTPSATHAGSGGSADTASQSHTRGGSHEQHVKAGQQSHKHS